MGYFRSPWSGTGHFQARFPKDANRGTHPYKEPHFWRYWGLLLLSVASSNYFDRLTTQLLTDGLYSWTCQFVPPVNIVLHQTTCLQISVGFKLNDRLTFWVVSHHSFDVSIINMVSMVKKSRIEKKYFSLPMATSLISILIKWIWMS